MPIAALGPWGYAATGLLVVGFLFFLYHMGKRRERARWEKAVYKKDMAQADAILNISHKHFKEREALSEKLLERLAAGDLPGAFAASGLKLRPKPKNK